jgi:spore maturation protein CgeB
MGRQRPYARGFLYRKPSGGAAAISDEARRERDTGGHRRAALAEFSFGQQFDHYVSHGYLADAEYRENIWRSKINLGFISHLNEDDIGHKCIEIAACGQFLMAVRSKGHEECFEEDKEAVFFSSAEECADKARFYLRRPDLRDAIGRRARERAVASGYDNDTQLTRILNRLDGRTEPGS